MEIQLSKKDKAALRELIEKGVQASFAQALEESAAIIKDWQLGSLPNREGYHALFKCIKENDKFIARRFDSVTGSSYVQTVVGIYLDKQITDEDLSSLSEELKEYVKKVANIIP